MREYLAYCSPRKQREQHSASRKDGWNQSYVLSMASADDVWQKCAMSRETRETLESFHWIIPLYLYRDSEGTTLK